MGLMQQLIRNPETSQENKRLARDCWEQDLNKLYLVKMEIENERCELMEAKI
jgi:hypothetical protein